MNKTNTFDFFVGINHLSKNQMQFDIDHVTKYKVERVIAEGVYINLRLIMSMKCVKHILFVKVALKRIELAKYIFILDMQQGKQIYIPSELQVDQFSQGLRFYDLTLNMLEEALTSEIKDVINFRRNCRVKYIKGQNFMHYLKRFVKL